ncbi:MAG: hypothetical protein WD342_17540 [Verrucomicrobiales bacterium]
MKLVTQLTPFTCGLACIESVCSDFDIAKTEADLLREFKNELLNGVSDYGNFGATHEGLVDLILQKLGFATNHRKDHRPEVLNEIFDKLDLTKTAILINANFNLNSHHCVRFAGIKEDDVLFVMDPSFNGSSIQEYSLANLIAWDYSFIIIERP